MELEFDVKINAGILYDYLLHHTYWSFQGFLGTAVGTLALLGGLYRGYIFYAVAGAAALAYLPWSLFLKSRRQMLANPVFREALHYRLTDEGVEVSQAGTREFQAWDRMHRAVSTRKSIVLYTSPINASLFPKADLGGRQEEVIRMMTAHMPRERVRLRG